MYNDARAYVDLNVRIETAFEEFKQGFREFWGLDANEPPEDLEWEEWYNLLALDTVARKLVAASLRLYKPESLPKSDVSWPQRLARAAEEERRDHEELLEQVRELGRPDQDWPRMEAYLRGVLPDPESFKHRFLMTAIQTHLGERFFPSIYSMSENLIRLVEHLTSETDPEVGAYLERIARCYLLGMTPELAVMSRAVVEVALERRLPAEYMRGVRGLSSNSRVPLELWIDEAAADGLLDAEQEAAAYRLRDLGSQVAHGKLPPEHVAHSILDDLHVVVSALTK